MSIIKNIFSNFINRAATAIVGIATTLVVARLLSEQDFGVLVVVLASLAITVRILSLGLGQASQYFGALSIDNNRENTDGFAISIIFMTVFSFCVVNLFDDIFARLLLPENGGYKEGFQYLKWLVPFCIMHLMASLFFLGRRELRKYSLLSLLPTLFCLIYVLIGFLGDGEKEVIWQSYTIQYFSSGVISIVLVSSMYSTVIFRAKKSFSTFAKMMRYGARSYIVSTISFSAGRVAIVVSAWYVSSEDVATYSIARTIGEAIILMYGSVGPLLLSYVAGKQQDYSHDLLGKTCRITLIMLIPLAIIIAVIAPVALDLIFGQKYNDVSRLLWILLPGVVISTQQRTLENYIYGRNKQIHLLSTHLIIIVIIFGLTALLGSKYGVLGVAYATSLSSLALFIMTGYVAFKCDKIHPKLYLYPRVGDVQFILDRLKGRWL